MINYIKVMQTNSLAHKLPAIKPKQTWSLLGFMPVEPRIFWTLWTLRSCRTFCSNLGDFQIKKNKSLRSKNYSRLQITHS